MAGTSSEEESWPSEKSSTLAPNAQDPGQKMTGVKTTVTKPKPVEDVVIEQPVVVAPAIKPCTPRKNIVFFKMHKCSSSTVQNILFRYGEDHDLTFVIPIAGNYLGHTTFSKRAMVQLPTKEYNILCHHTRFNEQGKY